MATSLVDASSSGSFYTWTNGSLWSKLDRVLMNSVWSDRGLMCSAEFLPMEPTSDHCPVLATVVSQLHRGSRSFKFYNMWLKHPSFAEVRDSVWGAEIRGTASREDLFSAESEGDRSTKYFHTMVNKNKQMNSISYLVREDGTRTTSKGEVATLLVDFFTRLMGTAYPSSPIDLDVLRAGPLVGLDFQTSLAAPVSDEEIRWALFDMGDERAPGPDGFTAAFFKANWDTVREDVVGFQEGTFPVWGLRVFDFVPIPFLLLSCLRSVHSVLPFYGGSKKAKVSFADICAPNDEGGPWSQGYSDLEFSSSG
ncbi:hypothetical protein LIER_17058 [Lithospermum erythrorhizon]|uniref:Endonuclease/exonuclease/phosphatase domain-containing protein n=1 Tax=Lithospermum erythrorhizon TaxID=34254 RepID=A0AAV3Q8X3_LITER